MLTQTPQVSSIFQGFVCRFKNEQIQNARESHPCEASDQQTCRTQQTHQRGNSSGLLPCFSAREKSKVQKPLQGVRKPIFTSRRNNTSKQRAPKSTNSPYCGHAKARLNGACTKRLYSSTPSKDLESMGASRRRCLNSAQKLHAKSTWGGGVGDRQAESIYRPQEHPLYDCIIYMCLCHRAKRGQLNPSSATSIPAFYTPGGATKTKRLQFSVCPPPPPSSRHAGDQHSQLAPNSPLSRKRQKKR